MSDYAGASKQYSRLEIWSWEQMTHVAYMYNLGQNSMCESNLHTRIEGADLLAACKPPGTLGPQEKE